MFYFSLESIFVNERIRSAAYITFNWAIKNIFSKRENTRQLLSFGSLLSSSRTIFLRNCIKLPLYKLISITIYYLQAQKLSNFMVVT